ncbi:MAG: hypothetical protein DHS20C05_10620 [Hyphococcus sp.]|nr:MAG: hypothetical protein DHS20C05_10620 [Marinicaulis sp.]
MGGSVFLTLFFGLFIAVGVIILGFGMRSLYMSKQAEHWPTVPGEIVASDFDTSTDSDGDTTYRTTVAYTYNVMGRDITGKKIAFGYSGSSGYRFHRDIYKALSTGSQLAVRYDPDKPERAVLSFGVNQSIIFLIIFGSIWTFFTLGMIAIFWVSEQGATSLLQNMIIYSSG